MSKEQHQHRKDEHLSLAVKFWGQLEQSQSFSKIRLLPNALPEIALSEVDISRELFGRRFASPFYIEAMTGGTAKTDTINAQLAEIAKNQNLAMAVGSQSIALKYPELAAGFAQVRELNPNGFIFANLGAGHSLEDAERAVDMLQADALELHINAAQELTMREGEGDRSFYWLDNIHEIASKLDVPVVVKEVGFGMAEQTFQQLEETAVAAINVGGTGGTDFAWIESHRGGRQLLDNYGLSTEDSLRQAKANTKPLIATGGIDSAQKVLYAQLLGARLASSAGFVLFNLVKKGPDYLETLLMDWKSDLVKLYALIGARRPEDLKRGLKSVIIDL